MGTRRDAPPSEFLIKLGILAQKKAEVCWDFWERAGLSVEDVVRALPATPKRWDRTVPVVQIVRAGPGHNFADNDLVAIPLLEIFVAAGPERGASHRDLRFARSRQAIVAPRLWCPNPKDTVCMEIRGDSMEPFLHDGYIVVVDQRQNDKKQLNGEIVVVRHDKFGLVVTRFRRIKNSEALLSDNRKYHPVPFTSAWRIVGKVLWWIGLPPTKKS